MLGAILAAIITALALTPRSTPILKMAVIRWQIATPTDGTLPYRRLIQALR